jgi:tetratricopeptide (TPR) repeat protein
MIPLILLTALAAAGNPQPFAPPGEIVEPDISMADPNDLLEEGRRRLLLGDYEGARIVVGQALERDGDHHLDATYLLGMGWEYDGKPNKALAIYEDLLVDWPAEKSMDDLIFRKAEALGRDRQFEAALQALSDLSDDATRTSADQVKVALLRGLWEMETDAPIAGMTRVVTTLDAAEPTDAPWHQAMARASVIRVVIDQASDIAFRGTKKKKARQVTARGQLVGFAETQLVKIIQLDRPVWALEGFIDVAHGYMSFGQAMLDESKPRVKKRARDAYEEERRERVVQVWVKATKRLDRGVTYANQLGWTGQPLPQLEADLSEVMAAIESL